MTDTTRSLIQCARSACKAPGANWWNTSTQTWYCVKCARKINEGAGTKQHGVLLCIPPHRMPQQPSEIPVIDIPALQKLVTSALWKAIEENELLIKGNTSFYAGVMLNAIKPYLATPKKEVPKTGEIPGNEDDKSYKWLLTSSTPEAKACFMANWLRGTIRVPEEVRLRIWLDENGKRGLIPNLEDASEPKREVFKLREHEYKALFDYYDNQITEADAMDYTEWVKGAEERRAYLKTQIEGGQS